MSHWCFLLISLAGAARMASIHQTLNEVVPPPKERRPPKRLFQRHKSKPNWKDASYPLGYRHGDGTFTGFSLNGHKYNVTYEKYDNPYQSGGPVVFVLHGRTMDRAQSAPVAAELACRGYTAVTFNHRFHGDRMTAEDGTTRHWVLGWQKTKSELSGPRLDYAPGMYYVQETSSHDVNLMMKNLDQLGLSKSTKVAVCGESMGGHTAQHAFVNNPRIALQASVVSTGNYLEYFARKYEKMPAEWRLNNPWRNVFNSTLLAKVKAKDPFFNLQNFQNRPFFVLNGGADTLVPADLNGEMVEELRRHGYYSGADADKLQARVVAKRGHSGWTQKERKPMYNFFEEFLPVNKQSGAITPGVGYKIQEATRHWKMSTNGKSIEMMEWSCFNFQHRWEVEDRKGFFAMKNSATGKYFCATRYSTPQPHAMESRLGTYTVANYAQGDAAQCEWQILDTGNGLYKLINKKLLGKLVVSPEAIGRMKSPSHTLNVHQGVTKVRDWHLDTFTFHRMD